MQQKIAFGHALTSVITCVVGTVWLSHAQMLLQKKQSAITVI